MSGSVYKKIEIVGTSEESLEEAIENAINKAAESIHNLRWFEVDETRGRIEDAKVSEWQVTVKIGFAVDP